MLVDYHVHTPYCGHAHGKIVQYIDRAVELGHEEIGFADHLGRYYLTHVQRRRFWDWGMNERNISRYIAELLELRDVYRGRIRIKIGLEIDFIEGADDLLAPFLDHFDFDFTLASIHCLPRFGWSHLSEYRNHDPLQVVQEYFRLARAALRSRKFSSIAHPDFIWRYLKLSDEEAARVYEREVADLVREALDADGCLEINANGYLWSNGQAADGPDPFIMLLGELRTKKVPVTLGSDAHDPGMVGKSFGDLVPVLHSWNITTCATFTEGKRRLVPLG
ncbi:MAG: histidinol-phosphatase HisJ family protein [Chitinispirillaceae bacterium]|nr:histidinol-phosphatase HisJ family protein [Chitinispirillaceae bacterium]